MAIVSGRIQMPEAFNLPTDVVSFLFNIDQGKHMDRKCHSGTCRGAMRDQVVVSYSDLHELQSAGVLKLFGRLLDVLPVRLFLGKPTVCRCGRLNL